MLVRLHGRTHRLGGAGVLHAHPGYLPKRPAGRRLDLSGYEVVMERYHIMDYFLNSVLYTVCACAGLIVFCAPAAFVMTKFVFRGRRLFQTLFSVALGLPGVMILRRCT